MKLYINDMVSIRCKIMVKEELKKLGLCDIIVDFGGVEILGNISGGQKQQIKFALCGLGLELTYNKKSRLIEKIKNAIIEFIHNTDGRLKTNFSDYLCKELPYDYSYLANVFSEAEGITIEKFILSNEIQRAKELIVYDELDLAEIASKLHYRSVAHLAYQFEQVTGLAPSFFELLRLKRRIALEYG